MKILTLSLLAVGGSTALGWQIDVGALERVGAMALMFPMFYFLAWKMDKTMGNLAKAWDDHRSVIADEGKAAAVRHEQLVSALSTQTEVLRGVQDRGSCVNAVPTVSKRRRKPGPTG